VDDAIGYVTQITNKSLLQFMQTQSAFKPIANDVDVRFRMLAE